MELTEIQAALRKIARGFDDLADAIATGATASPEAERILAALSEWRDRGLTRPETSALLRRHGFVPQTAGGWARGDWIEIRPDGLRYLTDRSRRWLADRETAHDD